jgi:hypothetical protein
MAVAIGGIVKTFVPGENQATEQTRNAKPEDGFDINFQRGNLKITTADEKNETNSAAVEQKGMMRSIAPAISEGLFELLWSPVVILISSFTSVITALLYFKTRQAGGETMRDLLKKFESAEMPHSKWQERVRQRLLQSGRTTGKS